MLYGGLYGRVAYGGFLATSATTETTTVSGTPSTVLTTVNQTLTLPHKDGRVTLNTKQIATTLTTNKQTVVLPTEPGLESTLL